MALYVAEIAANAIPGAAAKGLDQEFKGESNKLDARGGHAPPAVHSLEYVTAHVSHATAAAAAALGRVNDALSLLSYAQEVGAQAQGAWGDAFFPSRHGRANGNKHDASKAPRKIRTRLLSPAFTGISAHASASCAGRKEYGRPGSGWDLTAGPSCLAKLVEQGKAFLEFAVRNAEEVLPDEQDPLSLQVAASAARRSLRPPSRSDAVKSAATTRPSSALSRPPSAQAGSKDSMAPHGTAGRLRMRPWSAAAAAAGADGLGARLHQTDKQASSIRLEGGRLSAARSKLGARIRPASAIGLSREAAWQGAGSGESGSGKPVCGTLRELEAAGHQPDESSDSVSGPERHNVEQGAAAPSRAAFVAASGLANDYGVKKREQASNRRPRSAMSRSCSAAPLSGAIASAAMEPSRGSALHKSHFGCRSQHVHTTAGIPACAGIRMDPSDTGTGRMGDRAAPPLYHEACTRHAMRMEAAGVRAPRPRPASALR